jgi:hypothetical protein
MRVSRVPEAARSLRPGVGAAEAGSSQGSSAKSSDNGVAKREPTRCSRLFDGLLTRLLAAKREPPTARILNQSPVGSAPSIMVPRSYEGSEGSPFVAAWQGRVVLQVGSLPR